jgi:hypothetical protein
MNSQPIRRLGLFAAALLMACSFSVAAQDKGTAKPKAKEARIQMGEGHFNRDGKPFHYWDKEKEIPAVCARCHAANGLPEYIKEGKNTPSPQVKNAFACTNCHSDMLTYQRHTVDKVTFPSGVSVNSGDNNTNLCMTCHQGRESPASVNKVIAGKELDTPDATIPFVHIHYYPAGATVFGTDAKVAYEYPGKAYAGRNNHDPEANTCTACHDAHSGTVRVDTCTECHRGLKDLASLATIRKKSKGDFDGNGRDEGLGRELANMKVQVYAAIQQYARTVGGSSIAFSPDGFPYWYADTNGNGKVDTDEMRPNNPYKAYTPRLLQAIFNYTYLLRDPGAAYHNGPYALQIAYDTLQSLADSGKAGVVMRGKARP